MHFRFGIELWTELGKFFLITIKGAFPSIRFLAIAGTIIPFNRRTFSVTGISFLGIRIIAVTGTFFGAVALSGIIAIARTFSGAVALSGIIAIARTFSGAVALSGISRCPVRHHRHCQTLLRSRCRSPVRCRRHHLRH